jgi:hypothetical protein
VHLGAQVVLALNTSSGGAPDASLDDVIARLVRAKVSDLKRMAYPVH